MEHLTASERATLHFYEWERYGRGYHLCEHTVRIEPPFVPFRQFTYQSTQTDNGRVPSLFQKIGKSIQNLLIESTKEKQEAKERIPQPIQLSEKELRGLAIRFPNNEQLDMSLWLEFINILSLTDNPISFEIIGTQNTISIQLMSYQSDYLRLARHLKAYFPNAILTTVSYAELPFDFERDVALCDFGLEEECMRPITTETKHIDALTSFVSQLDYLEVGELAMFQLIVQGTTAPWSQNLLKAAGDGRGGSFFTDDPSMLMATKEKVSQPLFSCVMRLAVQANTRDLTNYIARELVRAIVQASESQYNRLIPLSNEGYDYNDHFRNLYHRTTNRTGMLMNSCELLTFFHFPNVNSRKLFGFEKHTHPVPSQFTNGQYALGVNEHEGTTRSVCVTDTDRLKHTHIIGVTGKGKSTFIVNLFLEDCKAGNGALIIDPHGDVVDDILLRIPPSRKDDVIVVDPSDMDYPIGLNLLHATTEAEKMVLSSDLVSAFKKQSTSWGDSIHSILSQAINAFLYSKQGGTLIDLKRFLIEANFRREFLKTIDDPSVCYYWEKEYPLLKRGSLSPLLTRLDTFLRPKIIRSMLAQNEGLDFKDIIEHKKIVLVKLAQGLIGEQNSHLLGTFLLSKLNQVAQGRQLLDKSQRDPFYVYLDEFQYFINDSILHMLSGARKFGLGLVLAHQELAQLSYEDQKVANSVLSNSHIRLCFGVGDNDAKKLEGGFGHFEANHLTSLHVGEVIARIGSSENDFNLRTAPLSDVDNIQSQQIKERIIQNSRTQYGKPIAEVEQLINEVLSFGSKAERKSTPIEEEEKEVKASVSRSKQEVQPIPVQATDLETQQEAFIEQEETSKRNREHHYLQTLIKKHAQDRGFKVTLEREVADGKRVDAVLENDHLKIACEVSVTNTVSYEVENIKKCLEAKYDMVFMISKNAKHLHQIKQQALESIQKKRHDIICFITPNELVEYLDGLQTKQQSNEEVVKGFRVKTSFESEKPLTGLSLRKQLMDIVMRKKKKQ
ncbi:MAG: type IV secretory system conjugative DNA transfer family protein [Xanthomarina gelatinilytica]|uniref:type IV secretory system conjugative DNA transfer family protein n=1 Tax=Xanthomarina gelatinilytica TaxID=1137281 RepID=UPI003A85B7BF